MLTYLLLTLYSLLFAFLAWRNFRLAVGLLIALLPAYLIRLRLGPLPSTLLELNFGIIFLVWLIKYAKRDIIHIQSTGWRTISNNKFLYFFISLFLLSSITGIAISGTWYASLGEWRAFFLEPMILFFILVGRVKSPDQHPPEPPSIVIRHGTARGDLTRNDLALFLVISSLSVSLLAIVQKITGQFFAPSLWNDVLDGRVTSFFTSPNAVALFLGPIFFINCALLASHRNENQSHRATTIFLYCTLACNGAALFFSHSLGGWLGLIVSGAGLLLVMQYKKAVLVLGALLLLSGLTAPVQQTLLGKGRSLTDRVELWHYTGEFLSASPKNFLFGTGIRQFFNKIQKPHFKPKHLARVSYPHNIFLNFWTEIGFFGMLSWAGIWVLLIRNGIRNYKQKKGLLVLGFLGALFMVLAHGLIDHPYFKNDLAFLFWIIAAASLTD